MGHTIGIDLGTTNSCVAYVSNNIPRVVPTEQGFNTLPSVVSFMPGGDVIIGQEAKEQLSLHPESTIYGPKRLLGRSFKSPTVKQLRQYFSYQVTEGSDGLAMVKIGSQEYDLPQIQGLLLKHLKRYAEIHLGESVSDAVIAVPAYYTDIQRLAVKRAAEYAGLNVKRLVNEPTAAALAHGFDRGFDEKILIYDLGGGTFDVSVLELADNVFEVVATGGDTFLGGVDFDNRIIEWVVNKVKETEKIDLLEDPEALQKLRTAAEHAKIELSLLANTQINIPHITERKGRPIHVQVMLTRDELNEITKDLVDRSLNVTEGVMKQQGFQLSDVNEIVLVGGQTRMPLVVDALSSRVGKIPRKGVHPEECVALGAALLGHSLDRIDSVTLLDVLSVPIGIAQNKTELKTVVHSNQKLPCNTSFQVSTLQDNQTEVVIDVFQGNGNSPAQADYLGSFSMENLEAKPAGQVMLDVTFELDEEGMLSINVSEGQSGRQEKVSLKTLSHPQSLPEVVEERVSEDALQARKDEDEKGSIRGIMRGLFRGSR